MQINKFVRKGDVVYTTVPSSTFSKVIAKKVSGSWLGLSKASLWFTLSDKEANACEHMKEDVLVDDF